MLKQESLLRKRLISSWEKESKEMSDFSRKHKSQIDHMKDERLRLNISGEPMTGREMKVSHEFFEDVFKTFKSHTFYGFNLKITDDE